MMIQVKEEEWLRLHQDMSAYQEQIQTPKEMIKALQDEIAELTRTGDQARKNMVEKEEKKKGLPSFVKANTPVKEKSIKRLLSFEFQTLIPADLHLE
jgi:predicted  nucleic acid-binding Zn-ribbon protein